MEKCKVYNISYKASHNLSHTVVAVIVAHNKKEAWDIFLSEHAMGYEIEDLRCKKVDISQPDVLMSEL